jgi:hypothetical protein
LLGNQVADDLWAVRDLAPGEAAASITQQVDLEAHGWTSGMYGYTVSRTMRTANDAFREIDTPEDVRSRVVLHVMLAGGGALLAFLTWLLTL